MKRKEVVIKTEYIRLDSLLKLVGACVTGGQAKIEIQQGNVFVNDEACTMRGKKIRNNDKVKFNDTEYEVKNL